MQRYFIQLAYKGTNFFGWQIQPNHPSIQETIEEALTKLNKNKKVDVVGCGRTDTGVHASKYFAHTDLNLEFTEEELTFKLNSMLPEAIAIQKISPVSTEAHARFDATKRTYHYFIHHHKDPFISEVSWYRKGQLDVKTMNKAAFRLLNHEDFECFSKVKTDVTNFNCKIYNAFWIKSDKGLIFSITANRFLRNMVRAIVGTLIEVGEGKMTIEEFQEVMDSKNRSEAGQSVPAKGLFLADIAYPYEL